MAKAKKQDTPHNAGAAGGTTKRAAGAKAEPKKASGSGGGGTRSAPLIDTDLAAAAAASMVLNRASPATQPAEGSTESPAPTGDKRETSAFKQLKQNLAKPAGGGLGGILGGTQAGKKSNQTFGGGKQVGRNQTFGADVNRSGVPRRTGG